jgi:methylase of polypeptide subunit release factors
MKRPEVPEGRDVRNEALIIDARRKAIARGLPYYFTCNMADVVLFSVALRPGEPDSEEGHWRLADITKSNEVAANLPTIEDNWIAFLDDLEDRLRVVETARPSVTTADVIAIRHTLDAITAEAIDRTLAQVAADPGLADQIRDEAYASFGFAVALNPKYQASFRDELVQLVRLGAFVIAQKLVLYRLLAEVGPKRVEPFSLDPLADVSTITDPLDVQAIFRRATEHAIRRSKDYETAFNLQPLESAVFLEPQTPAEFAACRVGEVWQKLVNTISAVSWAAISQNLVGFLYESIVDPEFRHQLGQHYTREDVVDLLTTFAVRNAGDYVLDPASGGGSFAISAYRRKRDLGDDHAQALAETWAFEITAGAAELTTISLVTADTHEPAAYPRVLLRDFFKVTPGMKTKLQIPGDPQPLRAPKDLDAVVGNPPYISYRRQTNQKAVAAALTKMPATLPMPFFSGKSDEYVWFIVHATRFLRDGGRLAFVVSSAILFSDYGLPLIRFLAQHYRIRGVIDSAVERWFVDADTNTVLLLLEREADESAREDNEIRFVRLRRPLAQLLPAPHLAQRRDALEDLVDELLTAPAGSEDPRFLVNVVRQGRDAGVEYATSGRSSSELGDDEEDDQ